MLLLFDIDGTLLDTKGAGRRAMEFVANDLFGNGFSFDTVNFGGNLDPLIFREAAEANGLDDIDAAHERFAAAYPAALKREMAEATGPHEVEPCVAVHAALAECRDWVDVGRATLGCLTGNYTAAGPAKLRRVGIDVEQFTITAWGDEAADRPGLVEVAMHKHGQARGAAVTGDEVVVIGDTVRDVACAKAHGCVSYAVCTGSGTRDELEAAGADVVADSLEDLELLRLLVFGGPMGVRAARNQSSNA
ncbi:MAG: HAD hydrolase-like protein [Planctomycetota bacterium]